MSSWRIIGVWMIASAESVLGIVLSQKRLKSFHPRLGFKINAARLQIGNCRAVIFQTRQTVEDPVAYDIESHGVSIASAEWCNAPQVPLGPV